MGLSAALCGIISVTDPEDEYAYACFLIEKYLHQTITPDYSVAKFMAEIKMLEKYFKEEKKASSKRSLRTMGHV
jgi:hypothetical protein